MRVRFLVCPLVFTGVGQNYPTRFQIEQIQALNCFLFWVNVTR
jgi:hypothetical protein